MKKLILFSLIFTPVIAFAGFCPSNSTWVAKTGGCYCDEGYKLSEDQMNCIPNSPLEKEIKRLNENIEILRKNELNNQLDELINVRKNWIDLCNGKDMLFKDDGVTTNSLTNSVSLKNPRCVHLPANSFPLLNNWICNVGYAKSVRYIDLNEYYTSNMKEVLSNYPYWGRLSAIYYCERLPENSTFTKTIRSKKVTINEHFSNLEKEMERLKFFRDLSISDKESEARGSIFVWREAPWDCTNGYEHKTTWEQGEKSYDLNQVVRCFRSKSTIIKKKKLSNETRSHKENIPKSKTLANGIICNVGYAKSLNGLYCVKIPQNAHYVDSKTDVWSCNNGYKELGNLCIKKDKKKKNSQITTEKPGTETTTNTGYNYKSRLRKFLKNIYNL